MSAIRFTFTPTPAPPLPPLPPETFTSPANPPTPGEGMSAPGYTTSYSKVGKGTFVSPAAPNYQTPTLPAGGSSGGSLGALPTLPSYTRPSAPGGSGVSVPGMPSITPDGVPTLGGIIDLSSNIQVGGVPTSDLPDLPGTPSLQTTLILPILEQPRDLLQFVLQHSSLDEPTRELMIQARTEYLDRKAMLAEQKVMADAAGRGFSGPVGIAAAEVLEITHETAVTRRKAIESVRDEALNMGRERLATAVAEAVKVEVKAQTDLLKVGEMLISHDEKVMALAKEVVGDLIKAYNTRVEVINEIISGYQGYLDQVEAYNSGQSAVNSVEIARMKNDVAKIDIFEGQLDAVGAAYDVVADNVEAQANMAREIRAYVDYAQAQATVSREEIGAFEDIVRGYSQSFGVRSAQLQAYGAKVEAEGSAASVFAANASAYASFWRTEASRQQGEARYISESAQAYNAELQNYSRYSQAFRTYISSVNDSVNIAGEGLQAWAQANRSVIRAAAAYNRASAERVSAVNAINLQKMDETNTRAILGAQTAALEQRIQGSLLQAEAQALAGRAQAAYSVTSESARVSYSGQVAEAGSADNTFRNSMNFNRQWTVNTEWEEDAV
jgi:hypothetical protein